jgi:hypothetical protein
LGAQKVTHSHILCFLLGESIWKPGFHFSSWNWSWETLGSVDRPWGESQASCRVAQRGGGVSPGKSAGLSSRTRAAAARGHCLSLDTTWGGICMGLALLALRGQARSGTEQLWGNCVPQRKLVCHEMYKLCTCRQLCICEIQGHSAM